jgi:hypothetical protein
METLNSSRISSRHLQYRYLPVVVLCCEDWTKEFLKKDLPVYIAEDPLRAVVRGTGMALKTFRNLKVS